MNGRSFADDLEDQAIAWHVRLNDPSASAADHAAFDDWIAAAPAHARAYDRARALWDWAGQAAPGLGAGGWYRRNGGRRAFPRLLPHLSPSRSWGAALSAALAAAVVAVMTVRDPSLPVRMDADYAAPPGPARPLDLADGSHLLMDGGAALNVTLGSDRRLVMLKRGRAWFDVSHTGVPFEVLSDKLDVRVVGTAFSVEDGGGGATVDVERGIVRVSTPAHPFAVTLTVGQRARVSADGGTVTVDDFNPAVDLAWRRDLVIFDQASLEEVAARLEHLRPGRVLVVGDDLRRQSLSGTFAADSPDAILTALSESMGVKVASVPGFLTILYR